MAVLQFTTSVVDSSGDGDVAQTITGVTAGSTIVAICANATAAVPATHSCADAQGSYTPGTPANDGASTWVNTFYLPNANSGSHVVTFTSDATCTLFITLVELSGPTSSPVPGTNGNAQTSPGTAHGAVTSNAVTISGAATLLGFCVDAQGGGASDEPAVDDGSVTGNVFTLVTAGDDSATFGSWTIAKISKSSDTAATFTAITGTHRFVTLGIAVLEPGGSGPTINTQPSDVVTWTGLTANFTVSATASGGSLTYQWQVSTDRGVTFNNVSSGSGGTTSSYTTAALVFSDDQTFYQCIVTDSNGTVTTRAASLRVGGAGAYAWTKA